MKNQRDQGESEEEEREVGILNARRKLRARRDRGVEQLEGEVAWIRGEIKESRKELKRFLKGLEHE